MNLRCRTGIVVAGLALCVATMTARAQEQEERALAAVRDELAALEARLDRENANREREYESLERAELATAEAAAALEDLRGRVAENRRQIRALARDEAEVDARLTQERDALIRQVRMSFYSGRQETLKLLLNQQDPAQLGRMMAYYDYLNRARAERIDRVGMELAALAQIRAASETAAAELAELEREQQAELEKRERLREQRREAVAELDRAIDSDAASIARLQREERRLAELVEELEAVLAEFPVDSDEPFGMARGKLPWPVAGTVLSRYGEARAGTAVRWQGIQVGAAAGAAVRAIYHGWVVYSDWLPGLGLLAIIDHGDGYMSLYGHNEALLKEVGDWVTPGEAISQVGDSGGQATTALYFEIRENGEPVNPQAWLSSAEPPPP